MREIKFRAWDKHYNYLTKPWIYGANECSHGYHGACRNHELVLMQYTGLKDKNGKEIYEGDIIKQIHFGRHLGQDKAVRHETIQEIVFNEGSFNVMLIPFNYEIIGNIYENPELLELTITSTK